MTALNEPAPWVGNTTQKLRRGGLNVRPNAPFYLTHHPRGWELVISDKGPEWLPQFGKLVEEAGVNAVHMAAGGADSSLARVEAMDSGKTILSWDLGYLVQHKTKQGQNRYAIRWSTPKDMAGTVLWKLDHDGWNNWRRGLIAEGIIAPPDQDYINLLMEEERRNIERLIERQHLPEIKKKMDKLREKLQNMEKAMEPEPPAPVRTRKPRAKK